MEEIIDMQMPVLLCAILLIVISIPLYFGKGSNMIAGYNDLSISFTLAQLHAM